LFAHVVWGDYNAAQNGGFATNADSFSLIWVRHPIPYWLYSAVNFQ